MYVDIANNNSSNHVLSWMLPDLREALKVKHNETFWSTHCANADEWLYN